VAESDDRPDGDDLERYEALRAQALGGGPAGWRHGLALLQGRGMAAWLRAARSVPALSGPERPITSSGVDGELVGVLAAMALAVVG
jgi:hypothetical protein